MKHLNEPAEPLADRFFRLAATGCGVVACQHLNEMLRDLGVLDVEFEFGDGVLPAIMAIVALQQEQIQELKARIKILEEA